MPLEIVTGLPEVQLTTTNATDITPVVPTGETWVLTVRFCNKTGSAVNVTLDITDNANSVLARVLASYQVPANSTLDFSPVRLRAGTKLRATASAANAIDVSIAAGVRQF